LLGKLLGRKEKTAPVVKKEDEGLRFLRRVPRNLDLHIFVQLLHGLISCLVTLPLNHYLVKSIHYILIPMTPIIVNPAPII
jgi:hypothetical protein